MEIALGIISIIGFCLSIYNFLLEIIKNRKHLLVSFNHVFRFGNGKHCSEVIHISIINKSSRPICITKIKITCQDKFDLFGEYQKRLFESSITVRGQVKSSKTWTSDNLPVKIEPESVFNGLIISSGSEFILIPNNPCQLEIETDKGKFKSEILFNDFSDEERLPQCREPDQ